MVRPAAFSANPQTAASNHFQLQAARDTRVQLQALQEFDGAVSALRNAGVDVFVLEDSLPPERPDAIFPNNWFSTHSDGTVVLYPLLAENRRLERRTDLVPFLQERFAVSRIIDLSDLERSGWYLEGTGSLILDRPNRLAHACLSPRTSSQALTRFAERMDYSLVTFAGRDAQHRAIYHTNVMLSIGRRFAAVCLDAIDPAHRDRVSNALLATGREIVELSHAQVAAFAGNLLELATKDGHCIALSESAAQALTGIQRRRLETLAGPLIATDLSTIEHHGGGSFRCMLAEIHLPRRS